MASKLHTLQKQTSLFRTRAARTMSGFGNFDVQSTAGISLPDGGLQRLGMPLAWNTALQYRIVKYFWPEFEVKYTSWPKGSMRAKLKCF
jgi:hypothetical protein